MPYYFAPRFTLLLIVGAAWLCPARRFETLVNG